MYNYLNLFLAVEQEKILDGFRAPLVIGFLSLVVSWLLTPYVRKVAVKRGAVDDPNGNERRIHKEPIPRWGGVAIYIGIAVPLLIFLPFAWPDKPYAPYLLSMLFFGALIVIMGALDDIYEFKAKQQALFLLAVGMGVQYFSGCDFPIQIKGVEIPLFGKPGDPEEWRSFGYFSWVLTAIYIFAVTKAMDMIDGLDGLAAGIAAISGAALSVVATVGGQPRVALIAAAIAGSAIGFLKHNFNPAKIFLGTGGSQVLGFMLATLSVVGAFKTAATVAIIIPLFIFGVPVFDAAFVIVRRFLARQPLTQGDKRHVHHTLIASGLSQKQAVSILYLVALVLSAVFISIIITINQP